MTRAQVKTAFGADPEQLIGTVLKNVPTP